MAKVIYEKQYKRVDLDALKKQLESDDTFPETETEPLTYEEIMKKLYAGVVYVALPDRKKRANAFIKLAITLSSLYEVDIKVVEHMPHISVTYYFNSCSCMGFMKEIISMADDMAFFPMWKATISP